MRINPFILLSFVLALTTCKKKEEKMPVAAFTTDKGSYVEGERIVFSNTSKDAARFRWTLPGGTTSTEKDLVFDLPRLGVNYSLQFKLEAISESGNKTDHTVKDIAVRPSRGKMVIYNSYEFSNYTVVYIGGVYKGAYDLPPGPAVPNCDQAGYPTFDLPSGKHNVTIGTLDTLVDIMADQCTKIPAQ